MDKQLRTITGKVVVASELSKVAKLQLLNFIKEEASDAQVKALLMDGKIVKLDKQAEEIVNDRFEVSEAGGRVAKLRKTAMSQASLGSYGIPYLIYRKIRSMHDNCTKHCGTYEVNTARRQHCMIKCKVRKYESQLASAKKAGSGSTGDLETKVVKAKAELAKSVQSFKQRGTAPDA